MLRDAAAIVAVLWCSSAAPQNSARTFEPVTAPIVDAGTVNALTGEWTPPATQPQASGTVIYNNTCTWTGGVYFTGLESCEDLYDSGRIPSAGAPGAPAGAANSNPIASFQFAYCTHQPTPFRAQVGFWNNLGGQCVGSVAPTPPPASSTATAWFDLTPLNLPGSPAAGMLSCHTVTVDTTGLPFTLLGDGDGVFDNNQALDHFTWSFRHSNATHPAGREGLVLSGDPNTSTYGTCSYATPCGTDPFTQNDCGTGLGTSDNFWINIDNVAVGNSTSGLCPGGFAPSAGTGCYFFGGYPTTAFASHWMKLDRGGSTCQAPSTYCTSKTSSSGCVPTVAFTGTPSASGQFVLLGTSIQGASAGVPIFSFAGESSQPFQGGFLCVLPPVTRYPFQPSGGTAWSCTGSFATPLTGLVNSLPVGQMVWIQYWFRDPGAASGTGLTNALRFLTCL